jgi:hypothetical protein
MKNPVPAITHHSIPINNEKVRTIVAGSPLAAERGRPTRHLLIANGWCGGNNSMKDLACGLVCAAMTAGDHDFKVVTYDEPATGRCAYDQSYRTERFDAVARIFGRERPVETLGYSRGWWTVTSAARTLVKDGVLSAAVGLTPIGLSPPRRRTTLVAHALGEAVSSLVESPSPDGGNALVDFARHILPHCIANPRGTVREVGAIIGADAWGETIALSHEIPTGIVRAEDDYLISRHIDEMALDEAGFRGPITTIAGSHMGVSQGARPAMIFRTILETRAFAHA